MRLIKNRKNGRIVTWNPILAQRDDMTELSSEEVQAFLNKNKAAAEPEKPVIVEPDAPEVKINETPDAPEVKIAAVQFDLDAMDKDALSAFADERGIDVDKRKSEGAIRFAIKRSLEG